MATRVGAPSQQEPKAPAMPAVASGIAAAAVFASGIGCFTLGLMTTLAEAFPAIKTALTFSAPVGSLSGKTTVAVVVWLIAWIVLHLAWRDREVSFGTAYGFALALIALGVIGTFPLFFQLFTPG